MTNEQSHGPDQLERLLQEHQELRAARTDASELIARVLASREDSLDTVDLADGTRNDPATPVRASRRRNGLLWVTAATVLFGVAMFGQRWFPTPVADAKTILRDVRETHSRTVDRCYQVQFAPDPGYWDGKNVLKGPSDTILWTRGDRFWADARIGKIQLVYGRDERGALWVSPSRSKGILLGSPGEKLPDEIAMYCSINAMTVPALVSDVLVDFDLRVDPPLDEAPPQSSRVTSSGNTVVWARLKPGRTHERISSALLEIDRDKTLVRLILWTVEKERPRGTVTFTLIDSGTQDDQRYRMQSHLDPTAEIQSHSFPKTDTETPAASEPKP